MAPQGRHTAATGVVLAVALLLSGCGSTAEVQPAARSLGEVLTSIARSQDVDVTIVRTGVAAEAESSDDQMRVALKWEKALPEKPLPQLSSSWDDMAEYAAEQLRATTCEAIFDVLSSGEVPNGQEFAEDYLTAVAEGRFPAANERAIMDEFDDLYEEAQAGTLTATDIRFSLMKLRYC